MRWLLIFCVCLAFSTPALSAELLPQVDLDNLKTSFEVTKLSVDSGEAPFGAVIAGPNGAILMTQPSVSLRLHDHTKHAESLLASKFCQIYFKRPVFRAQCTLYSSMEPCAMCMYTMFSAGIGRVVYGLSAERLYGVFNQYGDWPRINLTSREAASYMSSPMKVEGPFLEDEAEVIVHKALQAFAARGTLKSKEGK